MVTRTCAHCRREFSVPQILVQTGNGRFCSRACYFLQRGSRNSADFWKRVESISMTSLRFAKKFCFPFSTKHFCVHVRKLRAES
jgi:hypothetical protein